MRIQPFKLERYFGKYEFSAQYLLSPSDCQSLSMDELLQMASVESQAAWRELSLGYTESQGHPQLRREVAKLYTQVQAGKILIAAPEEAIFIAMQTMLEPGDQVVVLSPAYQSLHEIARSIGCEVIQWKLQPTSDRKWFADLDLLAKIIGPRTRMVVINFPHNPTGALLKEDELEAIVALARKHDLILFSDEMYRLLEYEPEDRQPSICDIYEKGISLSGLSKSFALPGLRIGWLAARDGAWVEKWQAARDYLTICSSAPSEILAIIALQNKEAILRRNLDIIGANLTFAKEFFSAHDQDFTWFPPRAGSVAFPAWHGRLPLEEFCQEILEKFGVMIVPGSMFDFGGGHFRIGLGRKNLPRSLELVAQFLQG